MQSLLADLATYQDKNLNSEVWHDRVALKRQQMAQDADRSREMFDFLKLGAMSALGLAQGGDLSTLLGGLGGFGGPRGGGPPGGGMPWAPGGPAPAAAPAANGGPRAPRGSPGTYPLPTALLILAASFAPVKREAPRCSYSAINISTTMLTGILVLNGTGLTMYRSRDYKRAFGG